jgi:hypothetical protein
VLQLKVTRDEVWFTAVTYFVLDQLNDTCNFHAQVFIQPSHMLQWPMKSIFCDSLSTEENYSKQLYWQLKANHLTGYEQVMAERIPMCPHSSSHQSKVQRDWVQWTTSLDEQGSYTQLQVTQPASESLIWRQMYNYWQQEFNFHKSTRLPCMRSKLCEQMFLF